MRCGWGVWKMDEEIFTPSVGCADSSPARGEPSVSPTENTENNLPPCGGTPGWLLLPRWGNSPSGADQREVEGVKPSPFRTSLKYLLLFLPPIALTALFYLKESDRGFMDRWVETYLTPGIQTVGKFWSIFPFSVAEVMTAMFIAWVVLGTFHTLYILVKKRAWNIALKRVVSLVCLVCWLWCGFCWLWNCTYRATGFAEKYALPNYPYTPEQLLDVTVLFAYWAGELSTQVPRNEDLSFAVPVDELFERGMTVYDNVSTAFPSLELSYRRAKPIFCSRLQSILGYTGVYFPFTGEANVNVDQTDAIIPFTIAHEMAHQRMVAAEQECNFVGVLACISSEDVVFQYSGWMMGLVYLINAVHALNPEMADEIMRQTFTDELRKDWNDNHDYWKALETPTREKANEVMDEVYDGYLKGQGQPLGLMSYDACVDLLVNYFYTP